MGHKKVYVKFGTIWMCSMGPHSTNRFWLFFLPFYNNKIQFVRPRQNIKYTMRTRSLSANQNINMRYWCGHMRLNSSSQFVSVLQNCMGAAPYGWSSAVADRVLVFRMIHPLCAPDLFYSLSRSLGDNFLSLKIHNNINEQKKIKAIGTDRWIGIFR